MLALEELGAKLCLGSGDAHAEGRAAAVVQGGAEFTDSHGFSRRLSPENQVQAPEIGSGDV